MMQQHTIKLKDVRTFHVGGRIAALVDQPIQTVQVSPDAAPRSVDLNGHYVTGQLYAQHFLLEEPARPETLMLWHGGAMTGVTWETTPDGRPGWMTHFLRQGYDVLVSDAVERGRSSWSPYPQIYTGAPLHRTQEDAWFLFRIGPPGSFDSDPAKRKAFNPTRFPVDAFDQLCAQFVPRWTTNTQATILAYRALLSRFDRVTIIAHSQGGWFAQRMAMECPELIAAVVLVEPAGAPAMDEAGVKACASVPHLYIWGDNCDVTPAWQAYKGDARAHIARLRRCGGRVDCFDLPEMGIFGNSHMPMMDDNSQEIAAMVRNWLEHGK